MPTCSVPYCINASGKTSCTFHEFPHETPLFLNKWLENIGRPNWRPGHRSVVCSEHFQKDDFDRQGRLRIGSFPSKFPKPPFRKKKKVDTDPDFVEESLSLPPKQETIVSSKVPLPVEKQVTGSQLENSAAVKSDSTEDVIYLNDFSSLGEESPSQRIGLASAVLSNNIGNENEMEVKAGQNNSPTAIKMTEVSPQSTQSYEVPKKRKILEESQPSSFSPGHVGSSFSLVSCRVCGKITNSNISIFGVEGRKLCLAQMINKCFPIEVVESESLPHCICKKCVPHLRSCFELITTFERTNKSLSGKDNKYLGTKDADPPIIHSKPVQPQHASRGNRRVLLLEMSLKEGIPVKNMITQAIDELSLRLKPKETREAKPQGRIMFLDLQGGTEAFPEQMKKAISMLFPSTQAEKALAEKKTSPLLSPSNGKPAVKTRSSSPRILSAGKSTQTKAAASAAPTSGKQSILLKAPGQNLKGSSTSATIKQPLQPKTLVPNMPGVSVTAAMLPSLFMNPFASDVSSSITNQTLFVQTPPLMSTVPLTILPNTSSPSSAVRIATLPGSLPPGVVPQIIRLPSNNLIGVHPKPAAADKATKVSASSDNEVDHVYEDSMPTFDSDSNNDDAKIPPLVPINPAPISKEKPKQAAGNALSVIDIAKMKDKVVTKINNVGKQIKLGDKIVGIVLRNSDSKDDIHKKLQATFSAKEVVQKDTTTKERVIVPKETVAFNAPLPTNILSGSISGGKKLTDRLIDVPSAVESPATNFDRRSSRKLSLSFMWRKTGFLVSSFQKLYTWQMAADDSGNVEPIITCRVCKFTTRSKTGVETHLAAHPELQCPICWKYFLTDAKVFEHMTVIHSIPVPSEYTAKKKTFITWRHNSLKRAPLKQYQCSRCDRRFKMKDGLKRHVGVCKDRTHTEKVVGIPGTNPLLCSVCNRVFQSSEALQEHAIVHAKRTSWLCDVCGMVMKSSSNYRTHVARHDENAHEYQFQCNICKKRFKLPNRFEDHMRKHSNHPSFICSSCGKCFNTLNGLRQHEILHGERKLQCRFCSSRFHRRDHLRIHESSHIKTHSHSSSEGKSMPGRMFTCRFCLANENIVAKFPSMRELMRHYSDAHALERGNIPPAKKFECEKCGKTFLNSTLLRHHHLWHSGMRPYYCSTCGAGFMIKERLRNHEMTHTNERPFKCGICAKGFRSRNVLKQHKLIHNDPSEFFKCQFCDKSFSRLDNLKTHTRVHTGEKPWKCLHCQRQFRLRSECSKHVQIAHQIPAEEVFNNIETLFPPNTPGSSLSEPGSVDSAIAAIAGITTVQDMELLIDDEDVEECDEDSLQ